MDWYSIDKNDNELNIDKDEIRLKNALINGLSVEAGIGRYDTVIKSYFCWGNTSYCVTVPDEIAGKSYQRVDKIKDVREFLENVAVTFSKDKSLVHLSEYVNKVPLAIAEEKIKQTREDIKMLQQYSEGWKETSLLGVDNDADLQLASMLEYKVACCEASRRVATGKKSNISIEDQKMLSAIYARDVVESRIADSELSLIGDKYLYSYASNGWSGEKVYCLDSFMQEGSKELYFSIAKECKKNGMTHVYDIGCCVAFQAKIFNAMGMKYTGIEMSRQSIHDSPRGKNINYANASYPFSIRVLDKKHAVAISNLCLGYELDGKDESLKYDRLAKDFDNFCGFLGEEKFSVFKDKFGIETIHDSHDFPLIWASKELLLKQDKASLEAIDNFHKERDPMKIINELVLMESRRSLKPIVKQKSNDNELNDR